MADQLAFIVFEKLPQHILFELVSTMDPVAVRDLCASSRTIRDKCARLPWGRLLELHFPTYAGAERTREAYVRLANQQGYFYSILYDPRPREIPGLGIAAEFVYLDSVVLRGRVTIDGAQFDPAVYLREEFNAMPDPDAANDAYYNAYPNSQELEFEILGRARDQVWLLFYFGFENVYVEPFRSQHSAAVAGIARREGVADIIEEDFADDIARFERDRYILDHEQNPGVYEIHLVRLPQP